MQVGAQAADVFRVIADPTRRRILELIAASPRTVGELVKQFDISQPAISQHLALLREAHLVTSETEGQRRRYRLTPAPLQEIAEWVDHFAEFWDDAFDRLGQHLEGTDDAR